MNKCKLGTVIFRDRFQLDYAYLAGSMYQGISTSDMVINLARAGMMGFLSSGGLSLAAIEENIKTVQSALGDLRNYGVNLLYDHTRPNWETQLVQLLLDSNTRCVEASAYFKITKGLVRYAVHGLTQNFDGTIKRYNHIIAKCSRQEIAKQLMQPAPEKLLNALLAENQITKNEANIASQIPLVENLCIEADSAGHTDRGVLTVLLPAIKQLANTIALQYNQTPQFCIGAAGGVGTPAAVKAAFAMGADFVTTGSINQCTVESGASDFVKSLLAESNISDTTYAPAGDMFEYGSKVQVFRKGILFPARANYLYELYQRNTGMNELASDIVNDLETNYFEKTIDSLWNSIATFYESIDPVQLERASKHPKHKMLLIFRYYFARTNQLALEGNPANKTNFQIHSGPALGAFNQWVTDTKLSPWANRHVAELGRYLLESV